MQLRIMRRIPLQEVNNRVTELEKEYNEALEDIPELFAESRIKAEAFEDYVEWIDMIHSLRAYNEGEDFDYLKEEVIELNRDSISQLTPRRMELLDFLSENRVGSINELAKRINRDIKNVYNDVKALEELQFISLTREGRRFIPELLAQEITLLL